MRAALRETRLWQALRSLRRGLRRIDAAVLSPIKGRLGVAMPMDTPDRRVLEQIILPHYAGRDDVRTVLFVGCESYTSHYQRWFRGRSYWTIEPDRAKSCYGSRNHVVDVIEHLDRHFEPHSLDLIVCNGVIGFGLDRRENAELAFQRCFESLRDRGELVVGWNDVAEFRPFRPDDIASLGWFEHRAFPPLGAWRHHTGSELRHVFDFYVRPAGERGARTATDA